MALTQIILSRTVRKYIARLQSAGHLRRQTDNAMARLLLLGFVLSTAVALTVQAALPPAKYTDKYDNVNLDRILSNGRILTNYIKCLMDEGPCTSEGRELKSKLVVN
jgi:Insect pheromone-binding family, A10/OS-D